MIFWILSFELLRLCRNFEFWILSFEFWIIGFSRFRFFEFWIIGFQPILSYWILNYWVLNRCDRGAVMNYWWADMKWINSSTLKIINSKINNSKLRHSRNNSKIKIQKSKIKIAAQPQQFKNQKSKFKNQYPLSTDTWKLKLGLTLYFTAAPMRSPISEMS